ncbi:bifunctional 3-dehydroquinate dehydratase/shikimate dehydrogenase, chloroplastic-like [Panicum virgatum]|uniref:bifunctional 3-dehydroquinate dehydratase/shikimate dehydrogenase, chloroplastic-like n=1 Tax=Panicum virgatum TaxID=38727 RepID=UPI0019D5917C|nr:bifunctional 3-dehydroquinate dehydratase/shikimate dehydrogenase, chloroplastic-like [Panicum virgatum]
MAAAAASAPAAPRGTTLVCASLTARSPQEMAAEVAAAAALGADVVELQVGCLEGFQPRRDLPVLLAQPRPLPVIVTYRPKWEGGQYDGEDQPRFEALLLAMELGAEYVDIEFKVADKFMNFLSGRKPETCKLIVSFHNYDYTPSVEELLSLVDQIQATGADIVKIATTATEIDDVSRMFQVLVHCKDIGAINTIVRRPDGKLVGYNTDYVGAIAAIEDAIRASQPADPTTSLLARRLFVVIGAGGAAKAVAYGAKEKGARVVIANRTFVRAQHLATLIGGTALTLSELENYHPEEGMILANATSVGMYPNVNESPLSKKALRNYSVVFDVVFIPKETRLL